MDVPSKARREWADLVTGAVSRPLGFFAAKILLGRLTASARDNPDPANIALCVDQIHNLYAKNIGSLSAQQDVQTIFGRGPLTQNLLSVAETAKKIEAGAVLLLAGDEEALGRLPKGTWIGGTIPYFICPAEGGLVSRDKVFVTDISAVAQEARIVQHDASSLSGVYARGPANGFSFVIIPAMSTVHLSFALNAPKYEDFGARPLVGWISGVHLDDLDTAAPKVFNGLTGAALTDEAVVLEASLPAGKIAEIGTVNLFEQGDGDTLTFPCEGFSAKDVFVNGVKNDFAAYILKNKLDTTLPLVADYCGASVNIAFQGVDAASGEVKFYGPVFTGIHYKHAKPVADYKAAFKSRLEGRRRLSEDKVVFSCNCILNYLYSELEGETTNPFVGPITFGEIAYQLLTQTLVYLQVHDV